MYQYQALQPVLLLWQCQNPFQSWFRYSEHTNTWQTQMQQISALNENPAGAEANTTTHLEPKVKIKQILSKQAKCFREDNLDVPAVNKVAIS